MKTITTKYIPATDTKGGRVKATDGDGNSLTLSWDNSLPRDEDNHQAAAVALCNKLDWHGTLQRGTLCNGGKCVASVFVFLNDRDQVTV